VAASLSLALAGCGESSGPGPPDAGSPTGDASMEAPADAAPTDSPADANASPTSWWCGYGGGPVATAELVPLAAPTDAGDVGADAADAGDGDAGAAALIQGTATFEMTRSGVDLTIRVTGCANGPPYPVVIHAGSDCATAMSQGPIWDAPRGQGITGLICAGNSTNGALHYTRAASDPEAWTVGGASPTDVAGHVLLLLDPVTTQPVACGAIVLRPDADAGGAPGPLAVPRLAVLAQAAGLCQLGTYAPDASSCPDPGRLVDCACTHCDLSACLASCSDYVTCLQGESATCANDCPKAPACSDCLSRMGECEIGFCLDVVGCATPTPGGPCSRLEACCELQGPRAQGCLYAVHLAGALGGDTTCTGLMSDWDFMTNGAFDPPCNFD
jgi:hypothetical protein